MIRKPNIILEPTPWKYKVRLFFIFTFNSFFQLKMMIDNKLPAYTIEKMAQITGNPDMKVKANRFKKMNNKVDQLHDIFEFFFSNDWCFETSKIFEILNMLSENERKAFNCNPKVIDWKLLCQLNIYGIQKYFFK